jgi:hypothetical protein
MRHHNSLYYERRTRALLRRIGQVGPFVGATLCCVRHRCGHAGCRCAKGEKHPSWRLTFKDARQKTVSVYVPVALLEEVRQWVKNHRAFKKLAAEISDAQLQRVRLFAKERRRRKP